MTSADERQSKPFPRGELWVKNQMMASEYFNDPENTSVGIFI